MKTRESDLLNETKWQRRVSRSKMIGWIILVLLAQMMIVCAGSNYAQVGVCINDKSAPDSSAGIWQNGYHCSYDETGISGDEPQIRCVVCTAAGDAANSGAAQTDKTTLNFESGDKDAKKASAGWFDGIGGWFGEQADSFAQALAGAGKSVRKALDPGFCETNADCSANEICKPGLGCSAAPACNTWRKDEGSSGQVRLVFIGDGFRTDEDLRKAVDGVVDWDGTNYGLMSLEPFKSHKFQFDIYYVRLNESIWVTNQNNRSHVDEETVEEQSKICGDTDQYILLSRQSFRSYAYFEYGEAYVSLGNEWLSQFQNRLVDHEFGHSFGKLKDEYVEDGKEDLPGPPNCASSQEEAESWWGDMPGTGYFDGCSYVSGNIRPTENSVMRDQYLLWDSYGPVNEMQIRDVLNSVSR